MPRIRLAWVVALILFAAFPLSAQEPAEPKPLARTRLEPGPRVTVGQPVTVVVEVLVPSWFTAAPRFPSVDVADAITIFETRGTNFTERIEGRTWAGQSRSYHVYPQRPGSFEIAAIPVKVRYSSESTGPRTQATVSPGAVRFEAVVPPGAENLPYFISTTDLKVEQSFDREPGRAGGAQTKQELLVGETLTRTITITVNDALAMVIPPVSTEAVPGLAVYGDPPEVRDEGGERGQQIVGTRVERTTYVAEEVGEYRLPSVELTWWDIDAEQVRTTALPELVLLVEPNPDLVSEIPLPAEDTAEDSAGAKGGTRVSVLDLLRRWGVPLAAGALTLLLLARLWRRYEPAVRRWLAPARWRRQESESVYFARFRRAARAGEARATWSQWTSWLDRIHRGPGVATIRAFVDAADDPGLEHESDALDALLFARGHGAESGGSTKALYRKVAEIRRCRRRSRSLREQDVLATLNPRRREKPERECASRRGPSWER